MPRANPTFRSRHSISSADLVELAHHQTVGHGACIIGVDRCHPTVELCVSTVPERFSHPGDALLGLLAPRSWSAIGLSVPIRARRLDPDELDHMPVEEHPDPSAEPDGLTEASRLTVLVHRDGQTTSLFDGPDMSPLVVDEPPEGWVPDLLRRALGLPTAPPVESLAGFVEAAWLDAVAAEVFVDIEARSDWSHLARLHPLHPVGPALPGPLLAVESQALELESNWGRMRRLWATSMADHGSEPDADAVGAAPGSTIELDRWFDDGSFARWISRTVPPSTEILDVVLMLVSPDVGSELVDALVTVSPTVHEDP